MTSDENKKTEVCPLMEKELNRNVSVIPAFSALWLRNGCRFLCNVIAAGGMMQDCQFCALFRLSVMVRSEHDLYEASIHRSRELLKYWRIGSACRQPCFTCQAGLTMRWRGRVKDKCEANTGAARQLIGDTLGLLRRHVLSHSPAAAKRYEVSHLARKTLGKQFPNCKYARGRTNWTLAYPRQWQ